MSSKKYKELKKEFFSKDTKELKDYLRIYLEIKDNKEDYVDFLSELSTKEERELFWEAEDIIRLEKYERYCKLDNTEDLEDTEEELLEDVEEEKTNITDTQEQHNKIIDVEPTKKYSAKKIVGYSLLGVLGCFVVLGITIGILFLNDFLEDRNDVSDYDNGYRSECFTREDGKVCCVSCKQTIYGDIGCATSCK